MGRRRDRLTYRTAAVGDDHDQTRRAVAISKLGQLSSGNYVVLTQLVQLDGIRLLTNLLAVTLARGVLVDPLDSAAFRLLVDSAHREPYGGCFVG